MTSTLSQYDLSLLSSIVENPDNIRHLHERIASMSDYGKQVAHAILGGPGTEDVQSAANDLRRHLESLGE